MLYPAHTLIRVWSSDWFAAHFAHSHRLRSQWRHSGWENSSRYVIDLVIVPLAGYFELPDAKFPDAKSVRFKLLPHDAWGYRFWGFALSSVVWISIRVKLGQQAANLLCSLWTANFVHRKHLLSGATMSASHSPLYAQKRKGMLAQQKDA